MKSSLYGAERTAGHPDFETSKRGLALPSEYPSDVGEGRFDTVYPLREEGRQAVSERGNHPSSRRENQALKIDLPLHENHYDTLRQRKA